MIPALRLDRGTLVMREVPPAAALHFTWDARSQSWRAPGRVYRNVMENLPDPAAK